MSLRDQIAAFSNFLFSKRDSPEFPLPLVLFLFYPRAVAINLLAPQMKLLSDISTTKLKDTFAEDGSAMLEDSHY
ncbi:hypothetical protein L484_024908 [Morus notabilis]|uniref:Uncharacterized protein n=1 Tax=Morus notabilis TaxID=981085 RepID=W9R3H1_9ROSA|nr:hypothetical protein L484_024908 [Morus notabilis]